MTLAAPDPARPVNPRVAGALAASPPKAMADVARVYASVLNAAEAAAREHARRAAVRGAPAGPLPDPAAADHRHR